MQSTDSDNQHKNPTRWLRLLPRSGRLRRLVFKFQLWLDLTMKNFDWLRDLDAELDREHFHNLTEVACDFDVILDKKDQSLRPSMLKELITEVIEGKMPMLSSRSPHVLRIEVTFAELFVYAPD